ncbi:uncharacterized protein KQ657_004191 [Scheffersomyces spartinae]|uniref:Uncharacterized protein n=1 Tax=Scheffersomyces spartinae TaxID=45513 RepID=A0A9P8AJQ7_9ASCO|nr:uncharacterized protein KQ657_004191 [Scheffersomyces spartinae]KAG7195075.1 hypothetical protein KQ657_004191 [Scheffersomyces spartinae]
MYIIPFLFILLLSSCCEGGWVFQDNKKNACSDGYKRSIIFPFTGFKIDRVYKWTGLFPPTNSAFISITHCVEGKVDYEKYFPIDDEEGNHFWRQAFCVLQAPPKDPLNYRTADTVKNIELSGKISASNIEYKQETSLLVKVGNLLRKKVDGVLEKTFQLGFINYSGKKLSDHFEDILSSTPEASLAWALRDLACYKFARRKRYAERDLQFYIPSTFVGGMYQYSVPDKSLKNHVDNNAFIPDIKSLAMPLDIPLTDKSLLVPIGPVIAQDITSQSVTYNINPFVGPIALTHRVPYLATATPWDLRFRLSDTPDVYKRKWAALIDVFEEYSFSEADANIVALALSASANWFHQITNPLEMEKLIANNKAQIAKLHLKKDMIIEMAGRMSLFQKGAVLLGGWNRTTSTATLHHLQRPWDQLQDKD